MRAVVAANPEEIELGEDGVWDDDDGGGGRAPRVGTVAPALAAVLQQPANPEEIDLGDL